MNNQDLLENVKTWLDIDNQIKSITKKKLEIEVVQKDLTQNLVGML